MRDAEGQRPQAKEEGKPPLPAHPQEEKKGGPPTAGRGGRGQGTLQQGPKGGKEEVQVLTEELNRRGLAYVWGLMGLPGGLAHIMIDSGDLVGDVVSEEFAQQANLAGEPCRKEIETAAAASKMQIIGRCYPIKLRIAGIRTSFEIQPLIVRGMKNAVNLGQLFLSRHNAHLTFTEGKVSLQIGGSEVYLEEKGYSGLDGRADSTPAAAGSYDRVPPGGREDRDQGRAEARESTRPVLFSPQERERQVVVEQPRARGWGSDRIPPGGREGRDQGPAEAREGAWTALLSPQERERLLGWPRVRGRGSPSHLRRSISEADCVICPLEGAPTERREHGQERRGDWDPRRERAEENRRRERERSRERLRVARGRGPGWPCLAEREAAARQRRVVPRRG